MKNIIAASDSALKHSEHFAGVNGIIIRYYVRGGGHQVLAYAVKYNQHLHGVIAIDPIVAADNARAEEMMRRIAAKKEEPFYAA